MKPQRKQANFRLPETLLDELKEVAERTDTPQAKIVEKAVAREINQMTAKRNREVALSK